VAEVSHNAYGIRYAPDYCWLSAAPAHNFPNREV